MPKNNYAFGIIGYPLGHSLSPALHNWVYGQINLKASYTPFLTPLKELENFISTVRNQPIHGLSVTIPHKQAIMEYLDGLDDLAKTVGAVNTLYWQNNLLMGANTDVAGFIYPLKARKFNPKTALVLGAGGAARAVLAGIRAINPDSDIFIAARNMQQAASLADDFMGIPIAWEKKAGIQANLVVNTTPMGMAGGGLEMESPLNQANFEKILPPEGSGLVYDLVYCPLLTPFLEEAQKTSCQVQNGLDMLLAQGLAQISLWTGLKNLPSPKEAQAMLTAGKLLG